MLQQILKDMYIDPELLAELSEEQKQILFIKIREEQIRRWMEEEEQLEKEQKRRPKKPPKPGKKRVNWKLGKDTSDWVWVMGEHINDKSISQIIEEEAQDKAHSQAEQEAEEFRKKKEIEIKEKMERERRAIAAEKERKEAELLRMAKEAELYQTLKEARLASEKLDEERKKKEEEDKKQKEMLDKMQEAEKNKTVDKVAKYKNRRSMEIYSNWKQLSTERDKSIESSRRELDENWIEQEKKSKVAEEQRRAIARRAREEHRQSLRSAAKMISAVSAFSQGVGEKPPLPPKKNIDVNRNNKAPARPPQPVNREAVINWFKEEERPKGVGLDPDSHGPVPWFHGLIPRPEAERLLNNKPNGTFLVRVSERVWGYTVSYRDQERCKHFLVDTCDGNYQFFGSSQKSHASLFELVSHYKTNYISMIGKEHLLYPCAQDKHPPDYAELFERWGGSTDV